MTEHKAAVPTTWLYTGIPFRPTAGTYGFHDAKQLPVLDPASLAVFAHIRTLEDVKVHAAWLDDTLKSPTFCEVDVDIESRGRFYRDQQDCAIWCFDPTVGVFLPPLSGDPASTPLRVVATSICEFFARIHMENTVWRKMAGFKDHPDSFASLSSFMGMFKMKDPSGLWKAFQSKLTSLEIAYLKTYAPND